MLTGGPWAISPYGERALLLDLAGLPEVAAVRETLRQHPLPGQWDAVGGARSVLVLLDRASRLEPARAALTQRLESAAPTPAAAARIPADGPVVLDTIYDGVDLEEVGLLTGLGADGVIAAHVGSGWTVAFAGFVPGFGYLTGGDPRLRVARRATARTAVPAGAVGLAGEYTGAYPRESPGGWQLIGRTDAALWRPDENPPTLLRPGVRVRFRAVDRFADPTAPLRQDHGPAGLPGPGRGGTRGGLLVLRPGLLTTVQDLGRSGLAEMGVGSSGAADRGAAARANAAVGNPAGAALLETVLGGLALRAHGDQLLALAGATGPARIRTGEGEIVVDATDGARFEVPDGAELRLGSPASGLRGYLAVRGGIAVSPAWGSRSTDQLSGLGPPPLRTGELLPVGTTQPNPQGTEQSQDPPPTAGPVELAVLIGPRSDRFPPAARRRLVTAPYTVDPRSNRIGLRLRGPALHRAAGGELPPEGLVNGAIQVPPDGEPVLFLADHPVTGGYPVIGVLTDAAIDRAAQLRPGATVRFGWTG